MRSQPQPTAAPVERPGDATFLIYVRGSVIPAAPDVPDMAASGQPPVSFCGTIRVTQADGRTIACSVTATAPATYTVRGFVIFVPLEKDQASGTLTLEVIREGVSVAQVETTTEYGTISISSQ